MFSYCLTKTQPVDIPSPCRITFKAKPHISRLLLLESLNQPLCELIVVSAVSPHQQLRLRVQSVFELNIQPLTMSIIGDVSRTDGQGLRIYHALNRRKISALAALEQGVCVDVIPTSALQFRLQTANFELVNLEDDQHLALEPAEVIMAKTVLARTLDYTADPQLMACELNELVQSEQNLHHLVARLGLGQAAEPLNSVLRLQRQLESKRTWLFRQYCHQLERPNWASSANGESGTELVRRLALYEMLASDELKSVDNMMAEDDIAASG
ncbi:hypothetical protein JYB87_07620 [Shewanella avicenniae]|uniref:Lon N-terminal domain-containing protein n=1 Tax=Shewanella avicenniae TaxID=2814294 RepID=A0ABX7QWP8_9GAMM|nr:hypothetical protein [Shewanella avicenniae]QSX35075.1 hypothetical protein JYB87_07620 [Shewanella avicenniae]